MFCRAQVFHEAYEKSTMATIVDFVLCYNSIVNNRDYKSFAEKEIYHVYNRGVGKMDIFIDTQDYQIFLNRLQENLYPECLNYFEMPRYLIRRKVLPPNSFDLLSFCLMPNHFHILIKQNSALPITQLILKICTGYSKYFNKKYGRVGSVFQDRFKSVRINGNEQLLWTSYYIHKNPIEASLVNNLNDYRWSSFRDYIGLDKLSICKKELILEQFQKPTSYLKYFNEYDTNLNTKDELFLNQDLFIDWEANSPINSEN